MFQDAFQGFGIEGRIRLGKEETTFQMEGRGQQSKGGKACERSGVCRDGWREAEDGVGGKGVYRA